MADSVDTLMVDVRANTQGFASDISTMRNTFDGTLVNGLTNAGTVLDKGLTSAISKGALSFQDLGKVATKVLDQIAAQAVSSLFGLGSGSSGGGGLNLGTVLGSLLGLPGRATGGPVSPGRPYMVGEQGPELFVPTSAGAIQPNQAGGSGRAVNVAITIANPGGTSAPQALQRSSRQIASAVRQALGSA